MAQGICHGNNIAHLCTQPVFTQINFESGSDTMYQYLNVAISEYCYIL